MVGQRTAQAWLQWALSALCAGGAIVCLAHAPAARAAEADPPAASRTAPERFTGPGVDEAALAAQRGGTQVSSMNLGGTVSGNQAYNLVTGSNTISEAAFSNSNGLPMVVQNSGNNVLIQNATIVNVQLK
jgi:hypothetical protein